MIKKLRLTLFSLITASTFLFPSLAVVGVARAAEIGPSLCGGANITVDPGACTDETSHVNNIITTAINIFSIVVGIIAVVMIITGGLKYITSGGNDTNVSGAKNTILYAVIGLVIVAFAQIIVHYVLNKANTAATT